MVLRDQFLRQKFCPIHFWQQNCLQIDIRWWKLIKNQDIFFFSIRFISLRSCLIVCHKKAGPLDTFLMNCALLNPYVKFFLDFCSSLISFYNQILVILTDIFLSFHENYGKSFHRTLILACSLKLFKYLIRKQIKVCEHF